ncbi:DNA excision repair Flap endonuclease [Cryptosporidium ubiquitum]|uniref:DNA excision repair Flap endonuclease n=1 Tax=Cryptosporidium ubiquitum TaxID=857276 RepID=A0A1J4MF79_9CRYT|nr:DNA excision repair Flap endonuclease [Cryptosporidium ubiquitum]OII71676.1 DNA excision repair Flap endonuclease [Cryptosporidium ubiquitum]
MGVKGLWDIVAPSGTRVKPETLEGQILAIDASIWLKQFLMGLKDKEGKIPQGAHLLGFFKRLCKLLYYGILPVIVFDGTPPDIKKRTLEIRRMQREMSEINMRRVANKLLLNTIRLKVARKVKDKVRKKDKQIRDEDKDDEYKQQIEGEEKEEEEKSEVITLDDKNIIQYNNKRKASHSIEEKNDSKTPNLFSSEDENNSSDDEGVYGRQNHKFKKYGRYRIQHLTNEKDENSQGTTSYFPVMGFLSERRRLDEMPEIDTNLFSMPVSISTTHKLSSKKLTKIEDFNAFLKSNELGGDERRLMDLPLDTEIDPQVFEQLNSKLQYEILIQLRDAWINALRSNAVDTKDNMNQFSNSQIECYLRYLRINQEIEKLKVKMAKECEEEQIESSNEEIKVIEYGQVYDPDNDNYNNIQESSSSIFEDQGKEIINEESHTYHDQDNSTLTGKIINFSKNIHTDKNDIDNHQDSSLNCNILSMKGYHNLSKITKKERIKFLQSTDYTKSENVVSNPLNTPLFDLEKLLNMETTQEIHIKNIAKDVFNDFNDVERLELLKENVDELFNISNQSIRNDEEKDDGFIVDIENPVSQEKEDDQTNQADEDEDWQDIEWEIPSTINRQEKSQESIKLVKNMILSNNLMSSIESKLDSILETEKKQEKNESKEETHLILIESEEEESPEETKEQIEIDKQRIDTHFIQEKSLNEVVDEKEKEFEEEIEDSMKQKDLKEVEFSQIEVQEPIFDSEKVEKQDQLDDTYLEDIKEIIQKEDEQMLDVNLSDDHYTLYDKNLDDILFELEKEQEELSLEFSKHDIILNSEVTKEMQYQICLLLKALGIPWIDSPGEAEAQASILTQLNICNGVLSDDSDCLIFGAKKVFRNFFSGNSIEMYDLNHVKKFLRIEKQEQFYILAILLGCDYTVGVNGIGPVNAVEVLKAYPHLEDMILFKNWSMNKFEDKSSDLVNDTFERAEFKRNHSNYRHSWIFPPDFPCFDAINAMRNPNIISDVRPVFGKIDKNSTIELMTRNTNLTYLNKQELMDS